ncbi:MAG: hypothetical protein UT11_C0015G0016 [Berkelbacteria bacterium GW2011_GWA2_38_9]|uniref:Uncharacterized protein n=1 Tax=Berkelbacteria bacterium GW2011_GWA2_38_9 TaxID=1618334 RepID=A0A0G0NVU8_9BACT|nr:MAG: hypothetical protein UT11_C0015G0016 [Berkelbacteria bacterium GW2011_GWA2_38_9]
MSKKVIYWLVGVVIVLVVAAVGVKTDGFGLRKKSGDVAGVTASNGYTAIFLSNGQVYFGQLDEVNDSWMKLSKIYYLQVDQQKDLQPTNGDTTDPAQQPKLSLVKLGNELHGPTDEMTINTKHVIFYESLKDDGKVSESIKKYLEDQTKK